jgi:Uma2 family endonuclease
LQNSLKPPFLRGVGGINPFFARGLFYYPDVSISCDPQDLQKYFLESPCLIFEVLSPSTERIDRNEKLINYRELDSLQEYVLVSQTEKKVEVHRRGDRPGDWSLATFLQNDIVEFQSLLGLPLSLSDIYDEVEL